MTPSLSVDLHHRHGRGPSGYLNELTWLSVCRICHDWIHAHPHKARSLGLLRTNLPYVGTEKD